MGETLLSASNMAMLLRSESRLAEAKELISQTFQICQERLGKDHIYTLATGSNLAAIYRDLQELQELIEPLLTTTYEGLQVACGRHHNNTLKSGENLASWLIENDKYQLAKEILEDVLAGRRRALGETHPDVIKCKKDLQAVVMLAESQRRQQEARKERERQAASRRFKFLKCICQPETSIASEEPI